MIGVDDRDGIRTITLTRPETGNVLNAALVAELARAVAGCEAADGPKVLVLRGGAQVFCAGGDFQAAAQGEELDPAILYDLWSRLACGPFVSVAVVSGRVTAGGVGLAAACDLVLADDSASFTLSELLFGLYPACVLPFLIRRVGAQRGHYMTLSTQAVGAEQALAWGLADAVESTVDGLLRKHLLRLRHLDKAAVGRYKLYRAELDGVIDGARTLALESNRRMFADPSIRSGIARYVAEGKFPWED
ncbi:MAG: enoyl-CoA hydratase/isomerase [Magnetospirillum sp.]|nr:enoyl-CoA hydratase/isomerase [Magnetospirillum sp.]